MDARPCCDVVRRTDLSEGRRLRRGTKLAVSFFLHCLVCSCYEALLPYHFKLHFFFSSLFFGRRHVISITPCRTPSFSSSFAPGIVVFVIAGSSYVTALKFLMSVISVSFVGIPG
ncbi:unnamed protein product [Ixodes pacificus]